MRLQLLFGFVFILLPAEAHENFCHVHNVDIYVKEQGKDVCISESGHFMTDSRNGDHHMHMEKGTCGVVTECHFNSPRFCWYYNCDSSNMCQSSCDDVTNHCDHARVIVFGGELHAICAEQGEEGDYDDEHLHFHPH